MGGIQHIAKKSLFLIVVFLFVSGCAAEKTAMRPARQRPVRVALVLGAGAAKGFAHIGVLKVLEANKIPINMVVGTSAGSFVGSLYAYGFSPYQLQSISFGIQQSDLADLMLPDNGFIKGEKLEAYVNRMVRNTPMEKLRIPFYAVATDIQDGKETVFGSGNTGRAVRASCSIPGVFSPVVINGRMYVDGGVVSPVAVDTARKYGADMVIAVDLSGGGESPRPEGTMETIMQAINLMYGRITSQQLVHADVLIRPKTGYIGAADFSRRNEAVLEGEKAAAAALPAINSFLARLKTDTGP
ncbi:MAG TPA: patatin-like phospholipase family protein [Geobacteraceae bacterium]|nr:patatin-like phospholipase family protein [Geobacteraceae bacterium]